jgi:hypothetical protein
MSTRFFVVTRAEDTPFSHGRARIVYNRTMHKSAFFFAAPLALVLACSTSNNSPSPDSACASLASALCKRLSDCTQFGLSAEYADEATCETREKISCLDTLNAPGTSLTPQAYQACAGAVPSAACTDILGNHQIPDACKSGPGTLADGTACDDGSQCKGQRCRVPTGQTCGVCSTIAAAGAACADTSNCDYGLVCANTVCVAPGAAGATCDAGHPCGVGFVCKTGTCSAVLAAGATCDPVSQNCDPLAGLFCNPTTKVCAQITIVAAGAQCGLTPSGGAACGAKGFCRKPVGAAAGTCVAAAADGQPCDTVNGPSCTAPATCVNAVCKLPDSAACK